MVPQPVYAVLMLFPITPETEKHKQEGALKQACRPCQTL